MHMPDHIPARRFRPNAGRLASLALGTGALLGASGWALHALALTRSGRQAEALAALRHLRSVLADELGLDPGQEVRDLEQAVLAQDQALQQWLRPPVESAFRPPRSTEPGAISVPVSATAETSG